MSDANVTQAFLEGQIEALAPFGFLVLGSASNALHVLEVSRLEDGGLELRIPGRPPGVPPLDEDAEKALSERGFAREEAPDPNVPWAQVLKGEAAAVELMLGVMHEVFHEPEHIPLNIAQGNRREEHEARQRLAAVAERIEKVLPDLTGAPVKRDADGDYVLPIRDVHVTVAPRIAPGGGIVVRIISISNVGVNVTPELGLFLANLNFGLIFGRFALDAANRAIWVDESLLGDHFSDDELRFSVHTVASVADDWDDRLKQMFGGNTHQEMLVKQLDISPAPNKPGQGLYL
jgi:hypothetical protein